MTAIFTIGIDLAKSLLAVHGVDATDKAALVRPNVPRARRLELIASLPPCQIDLKTCFGANHWAREFRAFGHPVRLAGSGARAVQLGRQAAPESQHQGR